MDWANERYVRLYTRDTGDWALWPWQTRALFCLILRKVDKNGRVNLGRHGLRALAAIVDMPVDDLTLAVAPLSSKGVLVLEEAGRFVRLVGYDRWFRTDLRQAIPRWLRKLVIDRADGICGICGDQVEDMTDIHIDHIVAHARGGRTEEANLQLAHAKCNLRKGAR